MSSVKMKTLAKYTKLLSIKPTQLAYHLLKKKN